MTEIPTAAGALAMQARADSYALSLMPIISEAMAADANGLAGLAAYLNTHGVPTARGGQWRPQTVSDVLRRLVSLGHDEFRARSRSQAQRDRQARNDAARARNRARKNELKRLGVYS